MQILLISPYHSGSHKAWAEGYARHSKHDIQLLTLPGRFWKWRMHGGAVTLARTFLESSFTPDLIVADDMLDATTFLSLTRKRTHGIPFVLYMHENQLTYPLPTDPKTGAMRRQHNERDQHYVFVNYASMLAADRVFFNSQYHLESWFGALPNFLKHYPDFNEIGSIGMLREKSGVLPVGIELQDKQSTVNSQRPMHNEARSPLIVWNQRWEYDKQPEAFFAALKAVEDVPFRVALLGERFSRKPTVFDDAREWLGERVVAFDYVSRPKYWEMLRSADITISTAIHEFFGISIVEAMACGVFPLLPNRLSYPELVPATLHREVLYKNDANLIAKLRHLLNNRDSYKKLTPQLQAHIRKYEWELLSDQYDMTFQAASS